MSGVTASDGVLVIVPAFNEEESVAEVVEGLRAAGYPVLVIDDGSTDGTRKAAIRAGATVVSLAENSGVGAALQAGFRWAVAHGYHRAVQCDADGQHLVHEVATLVKASPSKTYSSLVIGSRFTTRGARRDLPLPRRLAMGSLSALASRQAGLPLTDASSGFRLIQGDLLELFSRAYPAEYLGDTVEAIAIASRSGALVREVAVTMAERRHGTSSASSLAAIWYVLRVGIAIGLGADSRRRYLGPPAA